MCYEIPHTLVWVVTPMKFVESLIELALRQITAKRDLQKDQLDNIYLVEREKNFDTTRIAKARSRYRGVRYGLENHTHI